MSTDTNLSLEGETGMLQHYSDEDVIAIMQQLVVEAILEGRLDNVDDSEVEQAQEIGLSLGFVEQNASGGLELGLKSTAATQIQHGAKSFFDATSHTFGRKVPALRMARRKTQAALYSAAKDTSLQGNVRKAVTTGKRLFHTVKVKAGRFAKKNPHAVGGAALYGGAAIGAGLLGAAATRRRPLND